jgi:hypothetical protein
MNYVAATDNPWRLAEPTTDSYFQPYIAGHSEWLRKLLAPTLLQRENSANC